MKVIFTKNILSQMSYYMFHDLFVTEMFEKKWPLDFQIVMS